MKRREFITLLGGAAAACPLAARGQQPEHIRRLGVLMGIQRGPEGQARLIAFREALQNLGWSANRNVEIDERWAAGNSDQMRAYSVELVSKPCDVILVNGTQPTSILLRQTRTIPVVFVQVSDPIGSGLVVSIARPGGNATGFNANEDGITGKWLELIKELVPQVARVGLILSPGDPAWTSYRKVGEAAAASIGVELIPAAVRDPDEIARAIESLAAVPNSGLVIQPTSLTTVHSQLILELSARYRLPGVYPLAFYARAGGLASYSSDNIDLYRRAASYVDLILKGKKPGDLPVQAPTKYELVLNLKTAKALGLNVPLQLQQIADEVIE
jgi:putative tryptophan/tyrosine transport system substrate-binding protein